MNVIIVLFLLFISSLLYSKDNYFYGTVFFDQNKNQLKDDFEFGIEGAEVVIGSEKIKTDVNGDYAIKISSDDKSKDVFKIDLNISELLPTAVITNSIPQSVPASLTSKEINFAIYYNFKQAILDIPTSINIQAKSELLSPAIVISGNLIKGILEINKSEQFIEKVKINLTNTQVKRDKINSAIAYLNVDESIKKLNFNVDIYDEDKISWIRFLIFDDKGNEIFVKNYFKNNPKFIDWDLKDKFGKFIMRDSIYRYHVQVKYSNEIEVTSKNNYIVTSNNNGTKLPSENFEARNIQTENRIIIDGMNVKVFSNGDFFYAFGKNNSLNKTILQIFRADGLTFLTYLDANTSYRSLKEENAVNENVISINKIPPYLSAQLFSSKEGFLQFNYSITGKAPRNTQVIINDLPQKTSNNESFEIPIKISLGKANNSLIIRTKTKIIYEAVFSIETLPLPYNIDVKKTPLMCVFLHDNYEKLDNNRLLLWGYSIPNTFIEINGELLKTNYIGSFHGIFVLKNETKEMIIKMYTGNKKINNNYLIKFVAGDNKKKKTIRWDNL